MAGGVYYFGQKPASLNLESGNIGPSGAKENTTTQINSASSDEISITAPGIEVGSSTESNPDFCPLIKGAPFYSVERREMITSPSDSGYSYIRFDPDGSFSWFHNGISSQGGGYYCEATNGAVELGAQISGRTVLGVFDSKTLILTWDGVKYRVR